MDDYTLYGDDTKRIAFLVQQANRRFVYRGKEGHVALVYDDFI